MKFQNVCCSDAFNCELPAGTIHCVIRQINQVTILVLVLLMCVCVHVPVCVCLPANFDFNGAKDLIHM